MDPALWKRLQDPHFLESLQQNQEVAGYQSPTSGRITYNKVVGKRSFAMFTDILESMVPLEVVHDPDVCDELPSLARVLKDRYVHVYPQYFYMHATMEYSEFEDEEDQESMDQLLEAVDALPSRTALIGITIQRSEAMGSAHASAFIVWKVQNKYKFAYYDPLAFKKGSKVYDYAERAFVSSRFHPKIEFLNLNAYCFHKVPEEFHCTQYIMNAEYCYVYSLYFLEKWVEFGCKLHRASFRKAIRSTYVVEPEKLTRINNKESMIYRVVMMAFLCRTFLTYLKSLRKKERQYIPHVQEHIRRIRAYLRDFQQRYGFPLVTIQHK